MGLALVPKRVVEFFKNEFFLEKAVAASFLHRIHAAFEVAGAAAIERPDKAFFPIRPIFITGPHAIGEREEHESIEVFPVPDNAGKFLGG